MAISLMVLGFLTGPIGGLAAFFLLPQFKSLIPYIIGIALAMIAAGYLIHKGEKNALAKIERQNNEAVQKAQVGARNSRECSNTNGLWDIGSGKCIRP